MRKRYCDDGEPCPYAPHVHHREGTPVGTVCWQDGICWKARRAELERDRRAEKTSN